MEGVASPHAPIRSHGGGHQEHQHHHTILWLGGPGDVDTHGICFWIVALVIFTVSFEYALRALHTRLGKSTSAGNQMLSKVKDELMLMGFLSFLLTILEETVELEHATKLSFEWAHLMLFLAAMVLVLVAFALVVAAEVVVAQLHAKENVPVATLIEMARIASFESVKVSRTWVDGLHAAHYHAVRQGFVCKHHLPHGFNFSMYVHDILYEFVLELLEVPAAGWAAVMLLAFVNLLRARWFEWSAFLTPQSELMAFGVVGWILLAAQQVLLLYTRSCHQRLLKDYDSVEAETLHRKLTEIRDNRAKYFSAPRDVVGETAEHHHAKKKAAGTEEEASDEHGWRRTLAFRTTLLLGSLYAATFLLRYLGLAIHLRSSVGIGLGLFALLPIVIAVSSFRELVDRISFELAVSNFNAEAGAEAFEESYRAKQDSMDFRIQFASWFRGAQGGSSVNDLKSVYARYTDKHTHEIEKKGLQALLHDIYGCVPKERLDRVWKELNFDLAGGIDFDEFHDFLIGRGKHIPAGSYACNLFDECS